MEKFILSLLCKYLAWVVERPLIPFLKFLESIKVAVKRLQAPQQYEAIQSMM